MWMSPPTDARPALPKNDFFFALNMADRSMSMELRLPGLDQATASGCRLLARFSCPQKENRHQQHYRDGSKEQSRTYAISAGDQAAQKWPQPEAN
jgi:hypothetical protein